MDERDFKFIAPAVYLRALGGIAAVQSRIHIAAAAEDHAAYFIFLQPRLNARRIRAGLFWMKSDQPAAGAGDGNFVRLVDSQLAQPRVVGGKSDVRRVRRQSAVGPLIQRERENDAIAEVRQHHQSRADGQPPRPAPGFEAASFGVSLFWGLHHPRWARLHR